MNNNQITSKKKLRRLEKFNYKNTGSLVLSQFQKVAVISAFGVAGLLIITINIRPLMASGILIETFDDLNQQNFVKAKENFEKALSLSRYTVGTEEIREHLAINLLRIISRSELLQNPEVKSLCLLAIKEMEKQTEGDSQRYLKIKHNILLGQLYSELGVAERNSEFILRAINQYDAAIDYAPDYFHLYPIKADILARVGHVEEAIELVQRSKDILTNVEKYDPDIFYTEPLLAVAAKKYDLAYGSLEKLINYSGPERRLDAGRMRNILNVARLNGAESIPFLEKAYLLDENNVEVAILLAQLYAEAKDIEKAKLYADKIVKQDPSLKGKVDVFLGALE